MHQIIQSTNARFNTELKIKDEINQTTIPKTLLKIVTEFAIIIRFLEHVTR